MKASIFGATGMVGTEVLHQCLKSDQINNVLTIGRHTTGLAHPKLRDIEHPNFLDFSSLEAELAQVDICFYCLGVYQNQVEADKFWEITVDYLAALIDSFERVNHDLTFCLFSAQGADVSEKSPLRFAKAKGRAERILSDSSILQKYTFRPGFINPGRKNAQTGWSGKIAQLIYKLIPCIGIDATDIAKVMIKVGLKGNSKSLFSNREMRGLANGPDGVV
jgi:nucleoside-diphosphate-sugar epimerase